MGLVGWDEAKAVTPKTILEETRGLCRMTKTEAEAAYPDAEWRFLKASCASGQFMYRVFLAPGRVIFNADGVNNQYYPPRATSGGWIHIEVSAACQILPPERLTTDHSDANKFEYPAFAVKTFLLLVDALPETADLSTVPAGIDYMPDGE